MVFKNSIIGFPILKAYKSKRFSYCFGKTKSVYCYINVLRDNRNFFITFGLFSWRPSGCLVVGVIFKVCGGLAVSWFQNRSGSFCSIHLQNSLKVLKTHTQEISSLLVEKGLTESEIQGISNLPSEVYQSEIINYRHTSILHIGTPIACGMGLLLNSEITVAIIVIFLGLLSFPIGERFFKESAFRQEAELRIGRSARLVTYTEKIYDEHLKLTLSVNVLSQLPLIIFSTRFIWNGSAVMLPIFYGITQGLSTLTGTLGFQRARAQTLRVVQNAIHLIDALNSELFIITPSRWKEHLSKDDKNKKNNSTKIEMENGVVFDNFSPNRYLNHLNLSLTCSIPAGSACILLARSGVGKSTLLAALMHLVEHTGEIYYINSYECTNIHTLSQEALNKSMIYFKEDNIEKSARLVDLFKDVFFNKLDMLRHRMLKKYDTLLVEMAWRVSDNLIEDEITKLKNGLKSVFPKTMLDELIEIRHFSSCLLSNILKKNHLSTSIIPERTFASLSSGEKRKLMTILTFETVLVNKNGKLVIFDEPLAHLDTKSIKEQIELINSIQELPNPPSLLIITHLFIEELVCKLKNVQVLDLELSDDKTVIPHKNLFVQYPNNHLLKI